MSVSIIHLVICIIGEMLLGSYIIFGALWGKGKKKSACSLTIGLNLLAVLIVLVCLKVGGVI